jgi:hypothetical protein
MFVGITLPWRTSIFILNDKNTNLEGYIFLFENRPMKTTCSDAFITDYYLISKKVDVKFIFLCL